ncbi:hypothetical protein DPMN_085091 [Dreissena polymorpha]|uniref:Uncharacterized protein n=1 Tax=Dreissena polymorpha TaxID=45954 RepID=A0A9D3YBR8_DREPO|nr:hypothetical protein DPMN_085091 [Dreissena polymorpha]
MTCMSPLVDIEINLRAVVTNFCDPSSYPDNSLLEALYGVRCFSTIGLHPKEASKYTDSDIKKFCMLLERPEVVGFGEVGLDHSVPYADLLGQALLLKESSVSLNNTMFWYYTVGGQMGTYMEKRYTCPSCPSCSE